MKVCYIVKFCHCSMYMYIVHVGSHHSTTQSDSTTDQASMPAPRSVESTGGSQVWESNHISACSVVIKYMSMSDIDTESLQFVCLPVAKFLSMTVS